MDRGILRDHVKTYLLEQIQQGRLRVGESINLASLSRETKISVTPIREALSQFEHAGIVKALPNRGFVIRKMEAKEAEQLFETLAQLELMALEDTAIDQIDTTELRKQLRNLEQTHTYLSRLNAHYTFHDLLTGKCTNKVLLGIIRDLRIRVLFYEQAFVTQPSFYEHIDNQKEAIVQAIEEDNLPTAALILKMNWMIVLNHVKKEMAQKN